MIWGRITVLRRYGWMLPILVFMSAVIFQINLPGLYMDAVNPDYLAAQKLHPHLHNPTGTLPSKIFPVLGSLYHGVQNFYVDLPILAVFGFNVAPLRIAQALFGVMLLAAFFIAAQRLSRSTALAMLGALGLATDIAFTASFRTQFYIVMGGAAWLFVSLMLALPSNPDETSSNRKLFWSGFFSGLAGYGYFVLLFFVPGMLALVALRPRSDRSQILQWIFGLIAGFTPFVLGYLSLALKLHGIGPAVTFIHGMLKTLHPFADSGTNGGNLLYAWQMARLAITNGGNDAMIFGQTLPSWWGEAKFYIFIICTLALSTWSLVQGMLRRNVSAQTLIGLLPFSYLIVASLFGPRLWAHHFCVLVPFAYLMPISLLTSLLPRPGMNHAWQAAALAIAGMGCLLGNGSQQYTFHENLARSGGEGKSTSALTQLAVEARSASIHTAYLFPEWGFFTSFCLLTENKVRYVDDIAPGTLAKLQMDGYDTLRLVYWDPNDLNHYEQVLRQAGMQTTERTFTTRDERPVFYWLEGRATSSTSNTSKDAHPDPPPATPQAAVTPVSHAPTASPGTARPSDPAG